eukprot:12155924-Ditylum_brightwellii.AAC.1
MAMPQTSQMPSSPSTRHNSHYKSGNRSQAKPTSSSLKTPLMAKLQPFKQEPNSYSDLPIQQIWVTDRNKKDQRIIEQHDADRSFYITAKVQTDTELFCKLRCTPEDVTEMFSDIINHHAKDIFKITET